MQRFCWRLVLASCIRTPGRFAGSLASSASLILMVGSFVALVQFGRPPSTSVYEPAHIEDGKFVPQKYR